MFYYSNLKLLKIHNITIFVYKRFTSNFNEIEYLYEK